MTRYRKLIFSFFTVITLLSFGCSDSETTSVRLQDDPSSQGTVTVFDTDDELLDVRRRPDEEIISPGGNQQGGAGTQNPGSGRNQGGNGSGAGSGGGNSGGTVLPLEIRTSSPLREQKYDVELPQTLQVAGGVAPYAWRMEGFSHGLFPEDLLVVNTSLLPCPRQGSNEICDQEGYVLLKGRPKEVGNFTLRVYVRDAVDTEISKEFQISVKEELQLKIEKGIPDIYRGQTQIENVIGEKNKDGSQTRYRITKNDGDLTGFESTGEYPDSQQLIEINRAEVIKLEFQGAAPSYTWNFGNVVGVEKINTSTHEAHFPSTRQQEAVESLDRLPRQQPVRTERLYLRVLPSHHGRVIHLPLKITDNLGTEHPFPLQLQLDDECQRAGPPLIIFPEEDHGSHVIIGQDVTGEHAEIVEGIAPFSVRFVDSTLTLQGSEECTQHGHRMTAIMHRPWQTHTTSDERKFTVSGHFRYDVDVRLGPGSEACSLIMEQVRYEVTDACGRTQRMRRRYIIDYPYEDTVTMTIDFKAYDTDETSVMEFHLSAGNHSGRAHYEYNHHADQDTFRGEQIALEQYGDGGNKDFDNNTDWYRVTMTLNLAFQAQEVRPQPMSNIKEAHIYFPKTGLNGNIFGVGDEFMNFKFRTLWLETRYWYAHYNPSSAIEREYSNDWGQFIIPYEIEWKRKASPQY